MRYLLDTHVAVWAVNDDTRLSRNARAAIADPGNMIAVSLASAWEIAIKNNLGRSVREPFGMTVAEALGEFRAAEFELLAIDHAAIAQVETLPRLHGDPFDRLLVASALAGDWQFVTHDRRFADYGDFVLLV